MRVEGDVYHGQFLCQDMPRILPLLHDHIFLECGAHIPFIVELAFLFECEQSPHPLSMNSTLKVIVAPRLKRCELHQHSKRCELHLPTFLV